MNRILVVMIALAAGMHAGRLWAADFEANVGGPLASGLFCAFTFQDGQKLKMDVPVLFNGSKSLAPVRKTQAASDLTIVMFSTTGEDTGGPGFIRLSIVGGGRVIYSAYWKAGDFVAYAGQRSGMQDINTPFGDAAVPELQYSCETK